MDKLIYRVKHGRLLALACAKLQAHNSNCFMTAL